MGVGDRLEQAQVGTVAGLADQPVFFAHPAGQRFFQRAGRMGVEQEHTGLDDELAITTQGAGLRAHDIGMTGEVEVVVAV